MIPTTRRSRILVGAGGAAAVLVVLGLGVIAFRAGTRGSTDAAAPSGSSTAPTASPAANPAPALTVATVDQLDADLRSGDTTRLTAALAMPAGATVAASAVQSLAALRSAMLVPGTLVSEGPTGAVADVEVTDASGARQRWQFHYVWVDGRWHVAATVPVAGATP